VDIKAPIEKVFAFFADPSAFPGWHGQDMRIDSIDGQGFGMTCNWSLLVSGTRFQGKAMVVEYETNRKITTRFWGDAVGTNIHLFVAQGDKTQVKSYQDIRINAPAMPRAQWEGYMRMIEKLGESDLARAKAALEK
jgi:uncharacterized protein YndB with AHSA1/START domain